MEPQTSAHGGTDIEPLLMALSGGIRVLCASDTRRERAYRAMVDVIAHSTRDPKESAPRLAKIADVVHLLVERDVHQLCTDDPLTTLNGWVRFLERATFVQDGYASVLHPYNQAVRTFRLSQSTTCEMVHTQVRRTLRTFAPLWRASVRVATNVYVEVCQAYVRAGNSTWATFEATPARRSLVHWLTI